MTVHSPDQVRWQITPALTIALDATENIVVDILGNRARVANTKDLAEGVRQAIAAQRGTPLPEDDALTQLGALSVFVQGIAEMRMDGEPDVNGGLYDPGRGQLVEDVDGLIGDARRLLGIPDPHPADDDGDDEPPRFRWNDHRNANGVWCRCSHLPVSDKLAESDDKRCLHECPDSTIEPIPPAGPLSAPISPNGIGPAHDTGAE